MTACKHRMRHYVEGWKVLLIICGGLLMRILLLLFAGHALCDYPLQGDFLAKGKNINTPIPGMAWQQLMLAHCLIHCGMVLLITGSVWMALAELVVHYITDVAKCDG